SSTMPQKGYGVKALAATKGTILYMWSNKLLSHGPRSMALHEESCFNSAVWEFFKKCAADRIVAICNLCQMRLKHGKDSGRLGTTCLRRHMSSCHASRWRKTLRRSSSPVSTPTICPSSQCDSIPTAEDLCSQITLPQLLQRKKKYSPNSQLSPKGQRFKSNIRKHYFTERNTCRNSVFWEFFKKCAVERSVAICNLCQMRLKRGKDTVHLGTRCLRRHMNNCHTSRWRKTLLMDVPGPSSQCDIIPAAEDLRSQITLPQLLQRKKKYSPNHPQAQRLNASLAKLLALQLLPFQLVDSSPFREFAECAVPQWQVPKRHYFSHNAIPALYQHVEDNVIQLLGKAVSNKVHVTLDKWSSKHGQGRYISFKAHWVTLIAAGRDPRRGSVLELVHPPRLQKAACMRSVCSTTTTSPSSSSSSSSFSVSDNGSNLLSALRKGKLMHVPCLAHVLNLVVQRFLTKYPGLPELLIQARKVCSHFRRSFPASVRLAEIQREFHLPTNRLICDMPTRWNSTLAVLQRLHKQQRTINEYLCEYGTRTGSGQLVFLPPPQWLMIKDACTVLSPFEEATRMVRRDKTQGLVRGWEEEVHDTVILIDQEDSEANATSNLRCMGSLMMQSLLKDPRIRAIKERDHYWLATLLDPRYKGKVAELILPAQREHRMKKLEDALKRHLCNTFPCTGRLPSADTCASEAADDQRNSGEVQGRLTDAFFNFFSPRRPGTSNVGTHCQRLHHMVQDYLGARADLDTFPADDPLAYWVLRLDHWPEFSQYAMQLLGCPSSSVPSERTFSAAGGFVTDKRVRLSTDSVDRLTFIKMNQSWISSYQSPDAKVME
uniref:Uncharacterized protein n=1 Tax=Leptobrachium leishanense TaxID=445787 RepID=A0A8C5MBG2_9ANUR